MRWSCPSSSSREVLRNRAELVVHVGNRPARVGCSDDRRLIEGLAHLLEPAGGDRRRAMGVSRLTSRRLEARPLTRDLTQGACRPDRRAAERAMRGAGSARADWCRDERARARQLEQGDTTAENRRQPTQASTRHEAELGKRRFEQRIAQPVTGSAPPVQVAAIDGLDGEALGQEGTGTVSIAGSNP